MEYSHKQLVFGVGSARCGSKSLRTLLQAQKEAEITHEAVVMPWRVNIPRIDRIVREILIGRSAYFMGDIGPWYLPYVPRLIELNRARVICLKRDRQQTIDSFLRQRFDHCSLNPQPSVAPPELLAQSLPKFKGDRAEAAGRYWDFYYDMADQYQELYPQRFRIVPMEDLNCDEAQIAMCTFLGWDRADVRNVTVDRRYARHACKLFGEDGDRCNASERENTTRSTSAL